MKVKYFSFLMIFVLLFVSCFALTACQKGGTEPEPANNNVDPGQNQNNNQGQAGDNGEQGGSDPEAHQHAYNEYGLCACGEYEGKLLEIGKTTSASISKRGGKLYYRFQIEANKGYYQVSLPKNAVKLEYFKFYVLNNGSMQEVTLGTVDAPKALSSSDGYCYVVITAEATFNSQNFQIQGKAL